MRAVSGEEIERLLDYPYLVEAIRAAFAGAVAAPPRHHHRIPRPDAAEATLILMPAWQLVAAEADGGGFMGVKMVTIFPDNALRRKASVLATYVLMAGDSGEALATMDGEVLTLWRTAASSALAASVLARADASHLAVIGAGALAPRLIAAHAAVRPIRRVTITASHDREAAITQADIVSVATLAQAPLVRGSWLKPGTHVDLVGSYTPEMREADDDAIRRARIFVDTRPGMRESGDISEPLATGIISEKDIAGDLFEIARGSVGRRSDDEITLFKSVGHAIEDLAAAIAVWRRL
jgi:ornithine cyclodeaminase